VYYLFTMLIIYFVNNKKYWVIETNLSVILILISSQKTVQNINIALILYSKYTHNIYITYN